MFVCWNNALAPFSLGDELVGFKGHQMVDVEIAKRLLHNLQRMFALFPIANFDHHLIVEGLGHHHPIGVDAVTTSLELGGQRVDDNGRLPLEPVNVRRGLLGANWIRTDPNAITAVGHAWYLIGLVVECACAHSAFC